MALNELTFHKMVDLLQQNIEECFDKADLDVDIDNANGILAIDFNKNGKIILSRQPFLLQVWVAAKSGGYHLVYDETATTWHVLESNESLGMLLSRLILEQTGEQLNFNEV